jgi:hypothetical protein
MFPLWLASQGSARIGGRAVLQCRRRPGAGLRQCTRADCLGIEAVLADGRLYQGLNALKKDNTGYDLKDLLIGAEGTLGIITAATLKLFPDARRATRPRICNVASPARRWTCSTSCASGPARDSPPSS